MIGKKVLWFLVAGALLATSCSVLGLTDDPRAEDIDALEGRAERVNLGLADLPAQFVEYDPQDGRMLGERELFDVQNEFSFRSVLENPQTILGMTTVYPYDQRQSTGTERIRSQMELIARSITKGYTIGKNVDVQELFLLNTVGDAYSGRMFNRSLADIGYPEYHMRTQILVFERDKISVILLIEYVEELPRLISIEEVAELLDQRIMNLSAPGF